MWKTVKYRLKKKWKDMKPIVIYTSGANCGLCKVSQEYMKQCGVPYKEKIAVITKQDQTLAHKDLKKWNKLLKDRQNAHQEAWDFIRTIEPHRKTFKLPLIVDYNLNNFAEMSGGIQNYIQQNYIEKYVE